MMKKFNYFLIIIFAAILVLPTLDNIFNFSPIKELFEKRTLKTNPEAPSNYQELTKYPQEFEAFYNDNFGLRKTLITLNSRIMDKVFNQSPSERAVMGKDGWLYFDNYNSLADAEGKMFYDQQILENGVAALIQNWQELQKHNIDYVFVVAPDKSTIYSEFLPDYIKAKPGNRRLDQFLTLLKTKAPDFPIIDLRTAIAHAKETDPQEIYYKTDTHWNHIGAHSGYLEVIKFLSKNHPNLKAKTREQFVLKSDTTKSGDIADIMNLKLNYDVDYQLIPKKPFDYSPTNISETEKTEFHKPNFFTNKNQNLPVLFAYKDSFGDNLLYFLSENFKKSYYVNEFPCHIDLKIIKQYHADIVIQQMWEGRIEEVLKACK
jgi:alginate O-acetyltransferase complex protein AlgJ